VVSVILPHFAIKFRLVLCLTVVILYVLELAVYLEVCNLDYMVLEFPNNLFKIFNNKLAVIL